MERFGFDLPQMENKSRTSVIKHFDKWDFDNKIFDWINFETGEILTDYKPSFNLLNLIERNIDITIE